MSETEPWPTDFDPAHYKWAPAMPTVTPSSTFPVPWPGPPGKDGKDVDPAVVAELVKKVEEMENKLDTQTAVLLDIVRLLDQAKRLGILRLA